MTQVNDTHGHYTQEIPIPLPDKQKISPLRIGLISTCWNLEMLQPLIERTRTQLIELGIRETNISTPTMVPGSFELPFAAQALAKSGDYDGIICFGLLIKGETAHFEYISNASSQGLMQAQLNTNIPIVYGVLNCFTKEQAEARCGPSSQLPNSLAATVVNMAALKTKYYGGQIIKRSMEIFQ